MAFAREAGSAQLVIYTGDECLLNEAFSPAPVDVYAVQKGLIAILTAKAQQIGLLQIGDAINQHLGPGWTQLGPEDEARLTIENLLTMTVGMDDDLQRLGEIGRSWRYNNTAYQYLKKILCLGAGHSLQTLSELWLFEPLGMKQTTWVERASLTPDGTPITGLMSEEQLHQDLRVVTFTYLAPDLDNHAPAFDDSLAFIGRFHSALTELESVVEGKQYLLGERMTLADISWFITLHRLDLAGYPFRLHQSLRSYLSQLRQRSAFKTELAAGSLGVRVGATVYRHFTRLFRHSLARDFQRWHNNQ